MTSVQSSWALEDSIASGKAVIAFGPEIPSNGSWDWIGVDLADQAAKNFSILRWTTLPVECDLLAVVKHPIPMELLANISRNARIIYFAVDYFQSEEHLDSHADFLRACNRIIAPNAGLAEYLQAYAKTEILDHHVKYIPPRMVGPKADGPILWTGVSDNLGPLVRWVNEHGLPKHLLVLTNEEPDESLAERFGFKEPQRVTFQKWNPDNHYAALSTASAAVDIKGDGFAQRHKPATKLVDFLAAGLPVAANVDSAPAGYLRKLGFSICTPDNPRRWFSPEYQDECVRIGALLREALDVSRVGRRFCQIASDVLYEEPRRIASPTNSQGHSDVRPSRIAESPRTRVAVLSFLFNWPSTGGGIIHTLELTEKLQDFGYDVTHVYALNPDWGIGQVGAPLRYPSLALDFRQSNGDLDTILRAYREAVHELDPDHVIITDSWNMKPRLAQAIDPYPYILRFQSLECLCPLNNVRFLPGINGEFSQCTKHQLGRPDSCRTCVASNGHRSGSLHQWERALSGVGTEEYDTCLRQSLANAEAVFVVNHDMATMFGPYCEKVEVVPSGFDSARFSQPSTTADRPRLPAVLFAGLPNEWIKGFPYVRSACELLWAKRTDFELWVTGDGDPQGQALLKFLGWQNQSELATLIQEAEIVVVPTIAQEALGRTAVEAMGASRPVVASRIGGLRFTVLDGFTGLLAEPGNPHDLAEKIEQLLNDSDLRLRLGQAGRRRFEQSFSWDVIVQQYRSVLGPPIKQSVR